MYKVNNQDKELLRKYLEQYYIGRMKKTQLERRLAIILEDMKTPVRGINYTSFSHKGTGTGAASFAYRIDEIECRIKQQQAQTGKALLKVMDVLDFLEEDSRERMVLELRFIDCKKWAEIGKEMHLSRSPLFSYQNKAFKKLLSFKKVRDVLNDYEKTVGDRE